MNDFEYDVKQKKNLARNAQYKKSGSKSKKCALPHETLTKKELAALSGPCTTYNLARPMTYEKFKELPDDLKSEYLRKLDLRFHISVRKLADMLECSFQTAYQAFDNAGIHHAKEHRMSKADIAAWEFWLSDVADKKKYRRRNRNERKQMRRTRRAHRRVQGRRRAYGRGEGTTPAPQR